MKLPKYIIVALCVVLCLISMGVIYAMDLRRIEDVSDFQPDHGSLEKVREAMIFDGRYSQFVDAQTGLSLSYPSALGELVAREQGARCEADEGDACRRAILEFTQVLDYGNPARIISISIGTNPRPLSAVDGSIADAAQRIRSEADLLVLSERQGCELAHNSHGVQFVRCPVDNIVGLGSPPEVGAIWYIVPPNGAKVGVVVFSEDLERVFGLADANLVLEGVVDTVDFSMEI